MWFWIKYAASRRDLVAGITVRFVSAARLPRAGERISSAFVELTVNVVVSKRLAKKQQMQWTPRGAHPLLQVRTRTLARGVHQVDRRHDRRGRALQRADDHRQRRPPRWLQPRDLRARRSSLPDLRAGLRWTDGKRLSIEAAAERLHAEHPDIPRDLIETHVLGWLENCAPESYTDEQMEEFDQLMESWLEDCERKRSAGGK